MFRIKKTTLFFLLCVTCLISICGANAESLIDVKNYRALTSDHRAYRIGEPIVILVIESTKAESAANTAAQSDVSLAGSYSDNAGSHGGALGINGKNDGAGQTSRQGQATTQLSTRITEITDSGLFRIKGEHNLMVNGENQRIVLSGLIRADDIAKDNSILSNRIADAHIEIIGSGDVSDSQHQSILFKIFKWLRLM